MAERFVLVVQSPVLKNRLVDVLRPTGGDIDVFLSVQQVAPATAPSALIIELEMAGAIDAVAEWKTRWPSCFLVGSLSLPRQDLWNAGRAAGCSFIANAGSLPRQLRKKLAESSLGGAITLTFPRVRVLLNERLGDGMVGNLPDAPDGPIIVYRVDGQLYAMLDVCPHAGASLASGTLAGRIVTCAQHGSQFDVCDGRRLRGPSDFPLRTYPVVEERGEVYVELT
jgi:nitrite reductase/ring-hydroxylating ferredoxin subunit